MNEKTPEASVLHLTPAMAVMSVAVLAMAADGRWSKNEIERLRMMSYLQPLFRDIHSVEKFIGSRAADLRAVGPKVLLEDCRKALTPRMRETAYAWAVELVQSDGAVVTAEHEFLQELAAKFSVPGPLARKLQTAAAIRRRTA
ncbi:MAG: tellurite resistance TerB family protein [Elusimicrobiota bacterium]|nr:tellurite resistance TerB family protein [Elusimicrobiota bacterium]